MILMGVVAVAASIPHMGNAQGFYVRAGIGYAIPQAGQTMDGTAAPYSGSSNNTLVDTALYTSYNLKKISFSSGLHGAVAGGYMFNKHIGIDLAVDFGLSMSKYSYNDYNVPDNGTNYNVETVQQAQNPVVIIPSLVVQSGGEKVNLYMRGGLVLPIRTTVSYDQISTPLPITDSSVTEDDSWVRKGKFSIGISAAAGVQVSISDNLKFYCEASMMSLSIYTKEQDLNDVYLNGQGGYITQVPTNQRTVKYSMNFNSVTQDFYNQPAYSQPFSNLGISVGFIYKFFTEESSSDDDMDKHTQSGYFKRR
jgi:hypothetical protein